MNITFFIVLGLAFLSFIIPAAVYGIVSRRAMFNRGGVGQFRLSSGGHGFTAADARRPLLPL